MKRLVIRIGNEHAVPTEFDMDFAFDLDKCMFDGLQRIFDQLCDLTDILGDEYDLGRLKVIMDAERYGGLIVGYPPDDPGPKGPPGCCPNCGRYGGISWDAQTDVSTCALCGWANTEAALRREQDG